MAETKVHKSLKRKKTKWDLDRERDDAARKVLAAGIDRIIADAQAYIESLRKSEVYGTQSKQKKLQHAEQGLFSLRRVRYS